MPSKSTVLPAPLTPLSQGRKGARDGDDEVALPNRAGRLPWLLTQTAGGICALPLDRVIETMRMPPIRELAGMPAFVRGLAIVRGAAVPVIDLGLLLGCGGAMPARLVTVNVGTRTIALAVGAVIGLRAIERAGLDAVPPLLRDAANAAIAAVGTLDAELLLFLRAVQLVSEEVLAGLDMSGAAA